MTAYGDQLFGRPSGRRGGVVMVYIGMQGLVNWLSMLLWQVIIILASLMNYSRHFSS